MPRSPLTESIQKVRRLVTEIQGTLTVDEFNLLLDELIPEPEPEVKQAKKTRKKSSKSSQQSSSKSPRASGMAAQLKERRSQQQRISTEDVDAAFCAAPNCGEGLTNPIHDPNGGYGSYHPFVGSVPPAPASSPVNGESSVVERSTRRSAPPSTPENDDRESGSALSTIPSSVDETASAGSVAREAGGAN